MPAKRTTLELYKRHSRCETLPTLEKPPENPDFYFKCACNFYLRGFRPSGEQIDRKSLLTNDFDKADDLRLAMIREDLGKAKQEAAHGKLIDECIKDYLKSWNLEVAGDTLEMHTYVLGVFQTFCEKREVFHMLRLDADLLEKFRVNGFPGTKHNTRATYMSKLKCFLKEAFRLGWIDTALALKVKNMRAMHSQGIPFTRNEIALFRRGVLDLKPSFRYDYRNKPQTALLMGDVQLQTGLRISDVTQFYPDKMTPTKISGRTRYAYVPQKSRRVNVEPKEEETYLDTDLADAIRACDWMSKELPFSHGGYDFEELGQHYYVLMQEVGEAVGVKKCRPHRLRDTFAVRMLCEGMALDDLAKLLTHKDTKVTRKHYNFWVDDRSERLAEVAAKCAAASKLRSDEEEKRFIKAGAKAFN